MRYERTCKSCAGWFVTTKAKASKCFGCTEGERKTAERRKEMAVAKKAQKQELERLKNLKEIEDGIAPRWATTSEERARRRAERRDAELGSVESEVNREWSRGNSRKGRHAKKERQ